VIPAVYGERRHIHQCILTVLLPRHRGDATLRPDRPRPARRCASQFWMTSSPARSRSRPFRAGDDLRRCRLACIGSRRLGGRPGDGVLQIRSAVVACHPRDVPTPLITVPRIEHFPGGRTGEVSRHPESPSGWISRQHAGGRSRRYITRLSARLRPAFFPRRVKRREASVPDVSRGARKSSDDAVLHHPARSAIATIRVGGCGRMKPGMSRDAVASSRMVTGSRRNAAANEIQLSL
jgi:hypothetical protein